MCRFKAWLRSMCLRGLNVSIHPMCRFKDVKLRGVGLVLMFQYILCVGSSFKEAGQFIHPETFQYILCVGSRKEFFITTYYNNGFQYILCVGSS